MSKVTVDWITWSHTRQIEFARDTEHCDRYQEFVYEDKEIIDCFPCLKDSSIVKTTVDPDKGEYTVTYGRRVYTANTRDSKEN